VKGQALSAMFNDAGGPFPCDKVLVGSDKMVWEEFVEK
jgi:hypothetical protein